MAASLSVFAYTALDDAPNYVNCAANNTGYGTPVILTTDATFLITVTDPPPGATVEMVMDWYPTTSGTPGPTITKGGPAYVPGKPRYPAAGTDPLTFKVKFKNQQGGSFYPTILINGEPDYNIYGSINWQSGSDSSTSWGSSGTDFAAVDPGPPLGGGTTDPDPEPIPIIPGAKKLGWWVNTANANKLTGNNALSTGLSKEIAGVADEAVGWETVYGGVVTPDRREVIWTIEWTPLTDAPAPNITYPHLLGDLKTPDGVKISNPPQSSARRHGVLKLRATIDGVLSSNKLVLTMSPGGLYGTTAYSTEDVTPNAAQFWTAFRNTIETV